MEECSCKEKEHHESCQLFFQWKERKMNGEERKTE